MSAHDKQEGGTHYKDLKLEPWHVIDAWGLGFYDGNALKYIARWRKKGGMLDLKKAVHYLEKQIELEEKKGETRVFACRSKNGCDMPEACVRAQDCRWEKMK